MISKAKCKYCGKVIGYIKKKNGETRKVETEKIYFIPCNHSSSELFINNSGQAQTGIKNNSDGVVGYKMHKCYY